jgi:hypothetical protein
MEYWPPTKAAIKAAFPDYLGSSNIWCIGRLIHIVTILSLCFISVRVTKMRYPTLVKAFKCMTEQKQMLLAITEIGTLWPSSQITVLHRETAVTYRPAHLLYVYTDNIRLAVVHSEDVVTLSWR